MLDVRFIFLDTFDRRLIDLIEGLYLFLHTVILRGFGVLGLMPDRWVDLQTAVRMHQAVEGIHTDMREISTGSDVCRWIRATLDDL